MEDCPQAECVLLQPDLSFTVNRWQEWHHAHHAHVWLSGLTSKQLDAFLGSEAARGCDLVALLWQHSALQPRLCCCCRAVPRCSSSCSAVLLTHCNASYCLQA
jgi:hypothetical protein